MIFEFEPKPTIYKGYQMRSRLEARWAAFFDILEWEWTYEPRTPWYGWLPDFCLLGKKDQVYVEIKPVKGLSTIALDAIDKINAATIRHPDVQTAVFGAAPIIENEYYDEQLGWLAEMDGSSEENLTRWWTSAVWGAWNAGNGKLGFCSAEGSFHDRISGGYDGGCFGEYGYSMSIKSKISKAWNLASWKIAHPING